MKRMLIVLLIALAVGVTANAQQSRKAKSKPKPKPVENPALTLTGEPHWLVNDPPVATSGVIDLSKVEGGHSLGKPELPQGLTWAKSSERVGALLFKNGTWQFEGNADESARRFLERLNEQSHCSNAALLSALEDALTEFVIDPNPKPESRLSVWADAVTFEGDWVIQGVSSTYIRDLRTPAQKLKDQAAELERKSELAKRLRQIRNSCAGVEIAN